MRWLFVFYLALNLLDELCGHRFYAVCLSGVLRGFLHQLVFALRASDIVAAGHHVTTTKHFGRDWSSCWMELSRFMRACII
jgi:hypothetical protein